MRKNKSRRRRPWPPHHFYKVQAMRANRILKRYGFNLVGFTQYKWEFTFMFETPVEATRAWELVQKEHKLLDGWWYGYDQWVAYVIEEGRTVEEYRVITDFNSERRENRILNMNIKKFYGRLVIPTDDPNWVWLPIH